MESKVDPVVLGQMETDIGAMCLDFIELGQTQGMVTSKGWKSYVLNTLRWALEGTSLKLRTPEVAAVIRAWTAVS